jgi:polysaccharide pyruvyl transferase WcaK-like protein
MRPVRVFLVGLYGVDNLGDDAIRDSIERASTEFGAEIRHYAVRRDRVDEPRAVRLRGRGWRAYLKAIWEADRVVIGGGGLLKDEGIKRWQGYGLLLELLGTAALARGLGKSVALVGMGVGPIYTKLGAFLIAPVARLANVRLVRDQASADKLRQLHVRGVEVFSDPAFSMGEAMRSDYSTAAGGHWPPRRMLISARPWYLMAPDRADRWSRLAGAIAALADEAVEDGLEVEFACLYWPQDRAAAQEIVSRMRHGARAEIPDAATNWWTLSETLRNTDVLVAMRYHAVVCAAMIGTPPFAMAYEPKVVSLAQDLDVPMIDVNDPSAVETLPARVREFRQAPEPVPAPGKLLEATGRLGSSAREGLRKVLAG